MIKALFSEDKSRRVTAFTVQGHSGLSDAGSDILCAAVSAMTMLTVNTVTGRYGASAEVFQDEARAKVSLSLKNVPEGSENAVFGLLEGFFAELTALSAEYPENLRLDRKYEFKKG